MTENTSKTKLFVGGIPWKIRGAELREAFSQYWEIVFASVKLDRETRRSRGFGFVEFENAEDAKTAQAEMDGSDMEGRELKVDFAIEKPEYERPHREDDETETNENWEEDEAGEEGEEGEA